MQSTNFPDSPPKDPRKEWHAPKCRRKSWQTPKLTSLEFNDTKDGILPGRTENSSGTLPSS
jgi:hypothetical protein